ncbi:MAG: DUF6110 family protein [Synergistaceae bacterium]|nr:DUF6110 family protein [Synergistaceae bacterium]
MDWKKVGILAGTFVLGGAAYAFASSRCGRRSFVRLVNKGIRLKDGVACAAESLKEGLDDIVAEAREIDGPAVCSCEIEEEGAE